jgi:hypothetical protein
LIQYQPQKFLRSNEGLESSPRQAVAQCLKSQALSSREFRWLIARNFELEGPCARGPSLSRHLCLTAFCCGGRAFFYAQLRSCAVSSHVDEELTGSVTQDSMDDSAPGMDPKDHTWIHNLHEDMLKKFSDVKTAQQSQTNIFDDYDNLLFNVSKMRAGNEDMRLKKTFKPKETESPYHHLLELNADAYNKLLYGSTKHKIGRMGHEVQMCVAMEIEMEENSIKVRLAVCGVVQQLSESSRICRLNNSLRATAARAIQVPGNKHSLRTQMAVLVTKMTPWGCSRRAPWGSRSLPWAQSGAAHRRERPQLTRVRSLNPSH